MSHTPITCKDKLVYIHNFFLAFEHNFACIWKERSLQTFSENSD